MAVSNRDRVGRAMDLLREGLFSFVERELRAKHGEQWFEQAKAALGTDTSAARAATSPEKLDVAALLSIIALQWQYVFRYKLGKTERGLVGELQEVRNAWAHQSMFTLDDTNRALDSTKRLLDAVNAPQAQEVDKQLQEVLRQKFDELTKKETRKAAASTIDGKFTTGLPPWRDVITPHADVAGGNYMLAEFAADLWQVYQDQFDQEHRAPAEYTDPVEFFRRTYLTEGLADLLSLGMQRISGKAADPVVKLQTNFGGGKTHSMLGLYHLFGGAAPGKLTGIEPLMKQLGLTGLPKVHRAVMVGNKLSLTGFKKPDGIMVRTLWGELAWQLGHSAGRAKEAYELVREDDERGVSPSALVTLLRKFSPCVVLIDEWVAFIRQTYGTPGLPAGSFDANITFAQSLTEAFKAAPGCFLVASLPASDIEIGGEGGREALKRLENVFDRVQSTWRPATTDECFEIVRRRLFQAIDADKFAARDAVARAFSDMYRTGGNDFPGECREATYEERLQRSYPVHPELFDRLFLDWSHLERFQKTRGVLRLMASVIHSLWEKQDGNLLILPATIPMDDPAVRDELTRYMDETWTSVIEKDVDGPNSLPLRLDRENPTLGKMSACRRVSRTLYMGSAPNAATQNRGIDDRRIKLGCVQPGEAPAIFGDALRRLSDQATHVYVDQSRYWLATQPSVTRLAQDRAAQLERKADDVHAEIMRRLREEQGTRGDFAKVYPCPTGSGEVPDEQEARLVILSPELPHSGKKIDSPAMKAAGEYLERRGGTPRLFRNTLAFLAADKTRLDELEQAVRQHLAWSSIVIDATPNSDGQAALNLDNSQLIQAKSKAREADDTVRHRLPETYQWLIVPGQVGPQAPVEFSETRLQGGDRLAPRASKKMLNDGVLTTKLAGTVLRQELDKIPLWRGECVSVKQLVEDFAQYLYLPRVKGPDVITHAVKDGVSCLTWATEGFAYADQRDEKAGRYLGLRTASLESVDSTGRGVVVKPDAANRQLAKDAAEMEAKQRRDGDGTYAGLKSPDGDAAGAESTSARTGGGNPAPPARPTLPTRFYGAAEVDATRLPRDAGKIAQEIVAHLAGLEGADVKVEIHIEATIREGVDTSLVRVVTENCKVLKFRTYGFEH